MATKTLKMKTPDQAEQGELDLILRCDEVLSNYNRVSRLGWVDVGGAARTLSDKQGWEKIPAPEGGEPFHSFEDYVNRKLGKGRSTVYRAMQLVTEFDTIAEEDLRKIPVVNAMWLLRLKKRKGGVAWASEKWITQAQTQSEEVFGDLVNAVLPGAAKQEKFKPISVPLSLKKAWDKALKIAKWNAESEDDIDGLEEMLTYYRNGQWEGSEKAISNEQAFNQSREKSKKKPAAKEKK